MAVIIVSNRLPVKISRKGEKYIFKKSEGGLATGLSSVGDKNWKWIGWPGTIIDKEKDKANLTQELRKQGLIPVYLSRTEIKDFYEGFSNETIWPNFHYFTQFSIYNQAFWESYVKVNQKYCTEILKHARSGDTIWIHDYHLLLLPSLLRQKLKKCQIGFFLHIPFPSYEIFRQIPWHAEILHGLIGADLIGFHTYDYLQYFLDSLSRVLGLNHLGGTLEVDGRAIICDVFPMGINAEMFERAAMSSQVKAFEEKIRKSVGDQKMILSVDRLDYTKGITARLKAFQSFLGKYPEWREKVSLIQILVPSRDSVKQYADLKEEINRIVGEINSDYGTLNWVPVYYFYRSFTFENLVGFYRLADVAMVTPLRDGMNLVAKEYVISRGDQPGSLVLSLLAGASNELPEAIIINPYDHNELRDSIHFALSLPDNEKKERMKRMIANIKRSDVNTWVKFFLNRLDFAAEKQRALKTRLVDRHVIKEIRKEYGIKPDRIFFLDYDGTLTGFKDSPEKAVPDKTLLKLIEKLSNARENKVVIVSGRNREQLDKWFGKLDIDLVAEHGCVVKRQGAWSDLAEVADEWKADVVEVLKQFTDWTDGTFIEEKTHSLAWHYRKADSRLGLHRSRELINHLRHITAGKNLKVLDGERVVEVKNAEVNKGRACLSFLKDLPDKSFIFAAGDDWTDEDMFGVLGKNSVTVKVGSNVSLARYTVRSYKEVRGLLRILLDEKFITDQE